MHLKHSVSVSIAVLAIFGASLLHAESKSHGSAAPAKEAASAPGKLIAVSEVDPAWVAKARAAYPLDVCVASDEKLGSMGDASQFVYRVAGQPDRLVMFCCDGCSEDFMKEPAKHLQKIDAAKKTQAK